MKIMVLRLVACAIVVSAGMSMPARAQRIQIDHLDGLFPRAVETVDVTIDGSLIRMAAKFLNSNKPDEAAVRELVSALQGIYVKGVEFENDGEYTENDIAGIRAQLQTPGWEKIVGVRSKRDRENVEVYLMMNNDLITGIGALVWAPKRLYVINVVGPIDPERIGQLRGRFGIPDIDLDFSGVGSRNYRRNKP